MAITSEEDARDLPKGNYIRAEAEYENVQLHEVLEYFYKPEKRQMWTHTQYESLELEKDYPLHT